MNLLEMLGLNKNDVLDFFQVLERQAVALEGISGQSARQATAMERIAAALEAAEPDRYHLGVKVPRQIRKTR